MPDAPNLKFVTFSEELVLSVLRKEPKEGTLFVFPTERNRKSAQRMFQSFWKLENCGFVSFEDLKKNVLLPDRPVVAADNRKLLFFRAIDDESASFFHISNYTQSLDLANRFFELFEEFSEAGAPVDVDWEIFLDENLPENAFQMQRDMYDRLLRIRKRYRELLDAIDMDDPIFFRTDFTNRPERIDLQFAAGYSRVVFVNQFDYTRLERAVVNALSDAGIETTLYYQYSNLWHDEGFQQKAGEFQFSRVDHFRLKRVEYYETPDRTSELVGFLHRLRGEESAVLIDAEGPGTWDRLLREDVFADLVARGLDHVQLSVQGVDAQTAERLAGQGVRLLALRCAGFNNVDLKAAHEHGLTVARVPAYSPHAVAEHTLALILGLNRKIYRAYNRVREGYLTWAAIHQERIRIVDAERGPDEVFQDIQSLVDDFLDAPGA